MTNPEILRAINRALSLLREIQDTAGLVSSTTERVAIKRDARDAITALQGALDGVRK